MANDRYKQLYNDPTDLGSGSSLFVPGEVIGTSKLNSWSDEIHIAFLEAARVFGDLQNSQVASDNDLIYTTYFTNLARVIGDLDRLSPVNPPGHTVSGITYEQTLPDGQYEFELDFEISGSYNTSSGSSSSLITVSTNPGGLDLLTPASFNINRENLSPGEWWTEYEDSGTVRTLKGRKLVTKNISENAPTITFQASTGPGDYAYYDRFAESDTAKSYCFNVIPTVAQAEASILSYTDAGGFPTITGSSPTAVHTISFADLLYTHYKDKDGNIVIHKLADSTHGSPTQNAFRYKIPQYILDAANRNGGVIPEGMITVWRYYNTVLGSYILKPSVPDLSKPTRESFTFIVIDDETIQMTPPSTNTTVFSTSGGVRCVVAFSAISLAEAVGILRLKMQDHSHNGTDGTALIQHNNLLLPTEGAHKASAISFDISETTTAFSTSDNLQSALQEIDGVLEDHFLKLPATQIPEAVRHEDQNIYCVPAADLPDPDFETSPYQNLYGDNLRRNLYLLDAHLSLTDTTSNEIMTQWRHAATQIKMTPTSSQSAYSYMTGTYNSLQNHIFTNASEIVPVHNVRTRPSRFSSTNYNGGGGNGTVDNEHGGGDVWGFAEVVANTDIILDAGVDWRDRFVSGQIYIIPFNSNSPAYADFVPGGSQDYLFKVNVPSFNQGGDFATAIPSGSAATTLFFYTGPGTNTADYTLSLGLLENLDVSTIYVNDTGALILSVGNILDNQNPTFVAFKLSYSPLTYKRLLDPSNPDYVYVTNPPPSQVIS